MPMWNTGTRRNDVAPTVARCVSLPAPLGGRCAFGPAKPDPPPLLEKDIRDRPTRASRLA